LSAKKIAIALLSIFVFCAPAYSKTIHLSCKTKDGQSSSTYYVDIEKETVKEFNKNGSVRNLRVVLFTPSSINFEDRTVVDLRQLLPGGKYVESIFKHHINRSTLAYVVEMNIRYDVAGIFEKSQYSGKCIIVKTPTTQF
jgi:hypothetical protein